MEVEDRETLLIVLGAGASYDCLPGPLNEGMEVTAPGLKALPLYEVRPPVTQQLAEPRRLANSVLGRWRWARPVVDHVRRSLGSAGTGRTRAITLETAIRDYSERVSDVPEYERHLLATRFYLRDLMWECTSYMLSPDLTGGTTNHLTLLRRALEWASLGKRCVVIISFNYDLIMERAMESFWPFDPSQLKSCLAHDRVHLLKPHGSVQWHWRVPTDTKWSVSDPVRYGTQVIEQALALGVDDSEIVCLPYATHEWEHLSLDALVPALAMPVDDKGELVWPRGQQERLQSLEGSVSRVLTIEWRAIEPHFLPKLSPLVRQDGRVLCVAGGDNGSSEAALVIKQLKPHLAVSPIAWRRYGDGFSGLLRSEHLEWLLEE